MKYAGIKKNDIYDGEGVCVSFWCQGCPYRCKGCHNPQTWDFNGGIDLPEDIDEKIISAINASGIVRNFSVLGGEPLCEENISLVARLVSAVREKYPTIKIYIWTGATLEELRKNKKIEKELNSILKNINFLIDGPYIESQRDITLKLRGSKNQRILEKGKDF